MKKISIITGPIRTGKTTRLMHWASTQKSIEGLFQPVIDEKRFIYHTSSRTLKMLEVPKNSDGDNFIEIGNYRFSREVFNWGQSVLLNAIKKDLDWLVIDEIGPLELEGSGLEPAISEILKDRDSFKGEILCVVRDSIMERFLEHYKLHSKFQLFVLP